jgi:membrane-bound ClpP family serine protease
MTPILLLFIAGIMLLAADVFVTSFVIGGIGGAAMIAGCVLVYRAFGALPAGLAGVGVAALLGAVIYIELFLLPRTRMGKGLVVESTSGSSSQPPVAPEAVIGKPATAVTILAPSGYVLVEGRRFEAFCRSGHADRGDALSVIGVDNFRLIVTKP